MYNERIEDILSYFSENHSDELAEAKRAFFEATGEIYDDDAFFEERTRNYLEWFLFDRPFKDFSSALHFYRDSVFDSEDDRDRETIEALCHPVHSLFLIRRLSPKKNLVMLEDLADKMKYAVTERRNLAGLSKGDVFEARLLQKNDQVFFLDAFVIHPPEVKSFLVKTMKRLRKSDVEDFRPLMLSLQRCWMQSQRYSHVSPLKFYNLEALPVI